MEIFNKIIKLFEENQKIIIGVHSNPDGDTIGSALALYEVLTSLNKEVKLYSSGKIQYSLDFLPYIDKFTDKIDDTLYDLLVIVDVGTLERVSEEFAEKVKFKNSVVIDHHLTESDCCEVKYIDPDAAATGVIIYRLLKYWNEDFITTGVAGNLYTSIITDTGSFGFSNSNSEAFFVAGELVKKNIDPSAISEKVFSSQPVEKLRLLSRALSTLTVAPNGRWAYVIVTREMLLTTGATQDMIDGIVNFPRSIDTVKVAIQFKEIGEARYKASLRSKGNIDIEVLCRELGGGSHKNAAACKIDGPLNEVIDLLINKVEKILKR